MNQPPINKTAGLQWCQQDTEAWHRLLASFYQQFVGYRNSDVHRSAGEIVQLAHDLKNSALPCGAIALHEQAKTFSPKAPLPTKEQATALIAALDEVLTYLETAYPGILETAQGSQLRRALWQQLEQHNIKALTLFEQWATCYALDWPQKTVDDIRLALHAFNFQQAKGLLQAAMTRYGSSTS